MIKRLLSVLMATVMVALLAACGGSSSSGGGGGSQAGSTGGGTVTPAADAVKWKMATIYTDPAGGDLTYKSLGGAMEKFINDVNEKSGGRLVIEGFYASVLGGSVDLFQQMERGEIDVFYGQPMASVDVRFGAWSIPFLFEDYDEVEKIACDPEGEFFKLSASWIEEHNAYLLSCGITNVRGVANTKHPVATVEDVKDLKIRTYEDPVVSAFWEDICQAVPMAISEVYTALQTNSIDGLEFSPTSIITRKYYEVAKFYSDVNWQWTSGANFVVNSDAFDALDADLQDIVRQCALDAAAWQGEQERKDEVLAYDTLKENGVEIYNLTAEDRKTWHEYADSVSDKLRNAVGADAYDAVLDIVTKARG